MAKGRCYLYLGPEIGEKQDALDELRKSLGGAKRPPPGASASKGASTSAGSSYSTGPSYPTGYGLEENSFYAGETPVTDLVSILRNGSLFADTRLFLIKSAEALKKKDEVELLASYMEAPQEDTTLVLISEAIGLDKRLEKAAPAANKRIFWELFENRKTEWVAAFFRREGYRIGEEGIAAILELVENNTDALRRECSRLMLFLGKDKPVEAAEVEKWLSHTREESAFTLFSRIAGGDLPKSIETLHTLLASKEEPQAILAGLTWCFRKLRDYLNLTAAGSPSDFDFKRIGLSSSKARKDYAAAAQHYRASEPCLALIGEIDLLIRSQSLSAAPAAVLMDLMVCKLITGAEKPRERWYYY
jgi:DNA polymerase-3 subunit delta